METNPTPAEAAESLHQQEAARRDVVARSHPPLAATLAVCAAFGTFVAAMTAHVWLLAGVAAVALVVAAVVEWRLRGRRGRLTDDRAVRHQLGSYFLWYLPAALLMPLSQGDPWPAWLAVAAGVAFALLTLVYLVMTQRYQDRRFVAGDYRPWDVS